MSTLEIRNMLKQEIDTLSDDLLFVVRDFVYREQHGYIPNAETRAAIQETQDIISGKIPAKRFATVEELFADLEAGDE